MSHGALRRARLLKPVLLEGDFETDALPKQSVGLDGAFGGHYAAAFRSVMARITIRPESGIASQPRLKP